MDKEKLFQEMTQSELEKFSNPPAFFYPNFMWLWNERLTKKKITEQLQDMRSKNVKGVWPLPMPKNFRPNSQPSNLEPDYLTEEYFKLYEYMVKEAKRLGMKVWLYDEGGWPSGMANGRLAKENPSFARQSLEQRELKPLKGETVLIPGDCLAAFLKYGEGKPKQLSAGKTEKIKKDNCCIKIYYAIRQSSASRTEPVYTDLLNPKATKEFIRLTHEAYKGALNKHFGFENAIPLVFTDEPKVSNPPWTDDLHKAFKKEKGYDILKHLPAIFSSGENFGMQARIGFFDWWSKRFAKAFFGQIQKWCHKNKLLFAGHLGGEDITMGAQIYGYGQLLRIFRKMDIPGIDTIWRQIFPGQKKNVYPPGDKYPFSINENHHFPKYASSVAHQDGKPWVITESFAVYGYGLTLEQMKWITNFQYVRGVNITTISCYQFSTKEHFMGWGFAVSGHNNPLWKYMDLYHNYVARLSYLLSRGTPVVDTAVYYPVRDLWAAGPDVEDIVFSHDSLIKTLLENQCDFDLIDDDILEQKSTRIIDGKLRVGNMNYSAIYVSKTKWMPEASKEKLEEFALKGGRLVWVDDASKISCNGISTDLKILLKPLIQFESAQAAIRVCKSKFENGNLYFITNEDIKKELKCVAKFNEKWPPVGLDLETGYCHPLPEAAESEGIWSIPLKLSFAGSCMILFSSERISLFPCVPKASKTLLSLEKGWHGRRVKLYRIGKTDFEIKDILNEKAISIKLGDWRKIFGDDFSGDAEYSITFECDNTTAERASFLDFGKVNYSCEAFLNGENLGRRGWRPFCFPIKGKLKEGKNEIRIIVTNTIANQFATTKELDKWSESLIGQYHKKALCFSADSLPSGLFGPVRIQAEKGN